MVAYVLITRELFVTITTPTVTAIAVAYETSIHYSNCSKHQDSCLKNRPGHYLHFGIGERYIAVLLSKWSLDLLVPETLFIASFISLGGFNSLTTDSTP